MAVPHTVWGLNPSLKVGAIASSESNSLDRGTRERPIVPSVGQEIGRRIRASAGEIGCSSPVSYRRRAYSSNGAYGPETVALLIRVLDESFTALMNGPRSLIPYSGTVRGTDLRK